MITQSFAICLILASTASAFDWYSLINQNFAQVRIGLSQLNDGARTMNQSMVENLGVGQTAINGLITHINNAFIVLQRNYPEATILSTSQVPQMELLTGNMGSTADRFRQASTNNVMIPAQGVVKDILSAMNGLRSRKCAEKYATNLVQPRTSVGRLRQCLVLNIPFFSTLAEAIQLFVSYAKTAVDETLAQVKLCSPNSRNCKERFFAELPRRISNIVNNMNNLYGMYDPLAKPTSVRNKECVTLISADIHEVIQEINANVSAAQRPQQFGPFSGTQCV